MFLECFCFVLQGFFRTSQGLPVAPPPCLSLGSIHPYPRARGTHTYYPVGSSPSTLWAAPLVPCGQEPPYRPIVSLGLRLVDVQFDTVTALSVFVSFINLQVTELPKCKMVVPPPLTLIKNRGRPSRDLVVSVRRRPGNG